MTQETVMSTPIFDQLLREMAQHADPQPRTSPAIEQEARAEEARPAGRRRRVE